MSAKIPHPRVTVDGLVTLIRKQVEDNLRRAGVGEDLVREVLDHCVIVDRRRRR